MVYIPQRFDSNVRKKRCCMKQEVIFIANAITTYEFLEARGKRVPIELRWVRDLYFN
jgi:hypothetical protein